jgi:hypothetical protein
VGEHRHRLSTSLRRECRLWYSKWLHGNHRRRARHCRSGQHVNVYYGNLAGAVTVSYLDISNDLHDTTGTIYTGVGWTISHNKIHDSYSATNHNLGVGIYGGDEGVIEYNCFDKMGDYGANIFGHNNKFRMNEVKNTNYEVDNSGNGQSGGGKWWGTLNADITDNAWVDDGPGGSLVIWLDNGNSGTLISGNYFKHSAASAIHSETGFNLMITNNLFQDGGWGSGKAAATPTVWVQSTSIAPAAIHVPGSRYDNQITVSNNQFINNWGGIDIWQSGSRSCENSGEGWPEDAAYCSGGFPITAEPSAGGQYYFSHYGSTTNQGEGSVTAAASAGSTTLQISGAAAINDQIGFADAAKTTPRAPPTSRAWPARAPSTPLPPLASHPRASSGSEHQPPGTLGTVATPVPSSPTRARLRLASPA